MIIIGANHTQTQRLWLDLPDGRKGFESGSLENFDAHGSDVGEIKKVEVRGERIASGVSVRIVCSHMNLHNTPNCLN